MIHDDYRLIAEALQVARKNVEGHCLPAVDETIRQLGMSFTYENSSTFNLGLFLELSGYMEIWEGDM